MDGWLGGLLGLLVIIGPAVLGLALIGLPILLTAREHHRRYGRPLLEDWSSVSAGPSVRPEDRIDWID